MRNALTLDQIHPSLHQTYQNFHQDVLEEVKTAVARDAVVVVGMATNPFVKRARKALEGAGVPFTFLSYGGYTSQWKQRLALKMWSGWPTFPQVFVNGRLVGGGVDVERLIKEGKFQAILAEPRA